jgi:hypothetical protein
MLVLMSHDDTAIIAGLEFTTLLVRSLSEWPGDLPQ